MKNKLAVLAALLLFCGCGNDNFRVKDIRFDGIVNSDPNWVASNFTELKGKNILACDPDPAVEKVKKNPYVKDVFYLKVLPSTLDVKIVEKNVSGFTVISGKACNILEDGSIVSGSNKEGIEFNFNMEVKREYTAYVLRKISESGLNPVRCVIEENEVDIVLNDGFTVKLDKGMKEIEKTGHLDIIRNEITPKEGRTITGLDLRFKDLGILISGGGNE